MNFPKRRSIQRLIREKSPFLNDLNEKETEVASLINQGVSHKEIERRLGYGISYTVDNIHKKLHIHSTSNPKSLAKSYANSGKRLR